MLLLEVIKTLVGVKLTISEVLDELPEAYTKEIYENKCNQVYLYVYDRY
jgi:type I restriction enzyme R subunit